jgi:hypothetical protein
VKCHGFANAALLIDEMIPEQPVYQWVLSVPNPLRFQRINRRPNCQGTTRRFDAI